MGSRAERTPLPAQLGDAPGRLEMDLDESLHQTDVEELLTHMRVASEPQVMNRRRFGRNHPRRSHRPTASSPARPGP